MTPNPETASTTAKTKGIHARSNVRVINFTASLTLLAAPVQGPWADGGQSIDDSDCHGQPHRWQRLSSSSIDGMSRWEPNARDRLQQAALELYSERGFDQTTVAEIAQRAGLTERTFFRHFTDKREVVFWGEDALHELFVDAVASACDSASPIEAVAAGLKAILSYFEPITHESARQRQAVIAANAGLQERELIKYSSLATGIADALRRRGVADLAANLTAMAGVAVFKVAVERWINGTDGRDLSQHIHESLDELKTLAAGD